jgi:histidinol-phosphatase (PHP family)
MWANYHTHSDYCDGKGSIQDYVDQAKLLGMTSIGLSSHAPVPFETKWCMRGEMLDDYINVLKQLKHSEKDIEVYTGMEVDFIPDVTSPDVFNERLDYTIGSVHFVDCFPDGTYWEIDGSHLLFLDGLSKIFNNNIQAAIRRYFELTREMIFTSNPTIIGHFDKIKIQNIDGKFFNESESWYQDEIKKLINVIKSKDAIVEINTRGIYQKKTESTYPSAWILSRLHKQNARVTISSDAHHPRDLVNQFAETARLIHNIGFREIWVMSGGSWVPYSFNENGIIR